MHLIERRDRLVSRSRVPVPGSEVPKQLQLILRRRGRMIKLPADAQLPHEVGFQVEDGLSRKAEFERDHLHRGTTREQVEEVLLSLREEGTTLVLGHEEQRTRGQSSAGEEPLDVSGSRRSGTHRRCEHAPAAGTGDRRDAPAVSRSGRAVR
jgi:hypothetical protein